MRRAGFARLPPMKLAVLPGMLPLLAAAIAMGLAVLPGSAMAQAGTTSDATLPAEASGNGDMAPDTADRAAAVAPATDEPLGRRCASPEEIAPDQARVEPIAAAVVDGQQPLTIVVLGSLSGQDFGSHGPAAFAPRLQEILQGKLAARGIQRPVQVRHVGKIRASAADLARLVDREVLPWRPALVIWQVGRSDPRKGNPARRFAQRLEDGIARLRHAGIPVVVGDIQFHPQFEALFRTDDYRNYVRWVAGKHELPLLRRHEMIEDWSLSGRIDLDSGDASEQRSAYAFIQECLAFQAARLIVGAAGLEPGKSQGGT